MQQQIKIYIGTNWLRCEIASWETKQMLFDLSIEKLLPARKKRDQTAIFESPRRFFRERDTTVATLSNDVD